ncbi:uncharacterized protein LOC125868532 [Solanum stenotomum]|uniref:uncharacterized protein LOC125868532 n=1 Tax=Solanum stenotomum TaxID=172797 RepID=UPI0020D0B94B|nr:uncharacterized protein LOC125868532 [Solanum stenotomum]
MAKANKKARTRNYEYSQQRSSSGNLSQFQQRSTSPTPSPASAPSHRFRQDYKGRASSSKSQGSASGNQTFPTCPKCGKNHPDDCLADRDRCFCCGQFGHRLKDCQVTLTGLSLLLQQCQQVALIIRVPRLVQVAVSARTGYMLSKLARTRKILLMWSRGRLRFCVDAARTLVCFRSRRSSFGGSKSVVTRFGGYSGEFYGAGGSNNGRSTMNNNSQRPYSSLLSGILPDLVIEIVHQGRPNLMGKQSLAEFQQQQQLQFLQLQQQQQQQQMMLFQQQQQQQ